MNKTDLQLTVVNTGPAARNLRYRLNHPDRVITNVKKWRKANPEKVNAITKRWRDKNREKIKSYNKLYKATHKDCIRVYETERRLTEPHYRIRKTVGSLMVKRLRKRLATKDGNSKMTHLPYTVEDLIKHLESLFTSGMSWDNYGSWHIDHIIPDDSFNYMSTKDKSFLECWSLNNLQPLWAEDNIRKSNK